MIDKILNTSILKQAIEKAKNRDSAKFDEPIFTKTEDEHCKGCVAHQYFWLLNQDGRIALHLLAKTLGTRYSCAAIWKVIGTKLKFPSLYNKEYYEDLCDYNCKRCEYPSYDWVESHFFKRNIHI